MGNADVTAPAGGALTGPERQVVHAAQTGEPVDLRARIARLDDPAKGASWGAARTVRAEVLVQLLTGARKPAAGRVRGIELWGARITGQLDLEAAELGCPLLLRDCHLEQPVNLDEARAPVLRLPGCHVPGLAAEQLETRGNLELNQGFTATGQVVLLGAHIGGTLDLSGARLSNPGGAALLADGLTVDLAVFCREGFTATGEVRLAGAHVGTQLSFTGANLTNPGGQALVADGLTVDQTMFCDNGFTATGEVGLPGAHIRGQLDFSRARLTNPDGPALAADGLTVDQTMFCNAGFDATGEVGLPGARIGGQLDLSGACLCNPNGQALNAVGLTVDQNLFCGQGFTAKGEVSLTGARVGGQLTFVGACLSNPDGRVLDLEGVLAGELWLLPRQRPDGVVNLTSARVGSFGDAQATWPDENMLQLRGFDYDTLENEQVSVRDRIGWVRRHPGRYTPQPYEQLAAAYRRAGRDDAARTVAVAKQWDRRSALNPFRKLLNWLLYLTVGYGYRTWQAALWLLGLLGVGSWVFARAYPVQMVAAKQPAPAFSPVVYTLDRLVPVMNLGQRDAWIPQGTALRWSWVLTVAGWVLTTAVVAGLTSVLRRD